MDAKQAQEAPEAEPHLDGYHYWLGEFARLGCTSPQAEILADRHGIDRHAVREALLAARDKGVDPDFVFDCFS